MSSGRRRAWRSRHRVKLGSGWIVAMVIMLAAAMLFTGAVILGNHLRAEAEATDGVSAGDETTLPDFDASSVPDVIARAAVFGDTPGEAGNVPALPHTADSTAAETSGDTAPETTGGAPEETTAPAATVASDYKYNAYCAVMRDPEGNLRYRSELKDLLFGSSAGDENVPRLADGIGRFGGAYLCGVFHASYMQTEPKLREAMREYEISLAAELAGAGMGDLLFTGLEFGQDAVEFCDAVRARAAGDSCPLGVAVSYDFLSSPEARETLVRIGGSFDFIALDLRGVTDADEIGELLHGVRALIGIYRMRIIVSDAPGLSAAALDAGAANVAELPGE